jgi:hypothetical protein
MYCHGRQGTLGRTVSQLKIYRCLAFQVTGSRIKALGKSPVSCASCEQVGCHSLNRLESLSGDIKVNHRSHEETGQVTCVQCHLGTAHEGVGGRFSIPKMELCLDECHADMKDQCVYCHEGKALPGKKK